MSDRKDDFPTLDSNDLALLSFACGHALAWYKDKGRSKYIKAERAKYEAVHRKLSQILTAFEYYHEEGALTSVDDEGNISIYGPNATARRLARKAAMLRERSKP